METRDLRRTDRGGHLYHTSAISEQPLPVVGRRSGANVFGLALAQAIQPIRAVHGGQGAVR